MRTTMKPDTRRKRKHYVNDITKREYLLYNYDYYIN